MEGDGPTPPKDPSTELYIGSILIPLNEMRGEGSSKNRGNQQGSRFGNCLSRANKVPGL